MKLVLHRIRRLERVRVPDDREQQAVRAILEARRRHLGANQLPQIPSEWFADCWTTADRIIGLACGFVPSARIDGDNEEHSIGSASGREGDGGPDWSARALPIEFIELSRMDYGV